jgi:hypothetical protein
MFSAKLISDILPEFVIHNNNYSASEKEEKTQVINYFPDLQHHSRTILKTGPIVFRLMIYLHLLVIE